MDKATFRGMKQDQTTATHPI
jgi:aminopeptidase N